MLPCTRVIQYHQYLFALSCFVHMTLVFLPPNVPSAVQPLNQGIITSFKIQYKTKLLQWILSQYDDATLKDLRKVVPNIRLAIMWSYEVWSESDA
jgi:hypothetical protein